MNPSSVTCTIKPASLPVDLDDAVRYMRVDGPELISEARGLLARATAYAEDYQWSQLITSTWAERWDRFCGVMRLSKSPVQWVASVQYVDTAGTTQTLTETTDYTVDIYSKPARVIPAYGKAWPTTRGYANDVIITYVAGYGDAPKDVPLNTQQAIIMKACEYGSDHEGTKGMSAAIDSLLAMNSFRVFW